MAGIRPGVRWLLRLALRRDYLTRADVDREIAFHLDARTTALIDGGLDPDAARAEALARFGDLEKAREQLSRTAIDNERTLALRERLEAAMDDLRYVLRSLARSRAFSAAVILTLGLGIGANAAMFGIIDRLLLRGPEHIVNPHGLRRLYFTIDNSFTGGPMTFAATSYVMYTLLRDHAGTLDGVAAYAIGTRNVGTGIAAERLDGSMVTSDFFALLGVRPVIGRFFTAEEDRPPAGQRLVVIGYELWERLYQRDREAVGKTLAIDGEPFTVIGVVPRGFSGAELRRSEYWIPMSLSTIRPDWPTTWRAQWVRIVARAKPGVDPGVASAEIEKLFRQNFTEQNPQMRQATLALLPISYTPSGKEGAETPVSRWLAGVSVIVLLIGCANVANLLLARVTQRRREVAVRLALGVSRGRLARLLMSEGVILALLGCVLGLVLAHWGGQIIRAVLLPNVLWTSVPVSGRVLVYSIAAALVAGALVGLAPVLQTRRLDVNHALKSGTLQSGTSPSTLRQTLVFLQAALSVMLLVGAGLFIKSLSNVTSLDLGIRPDRVLQGELSWARRPSSREEWQAELARQRQVYAEVTRRLRATPGIIAAGTAVGSPFGNSFGVDLWVPGYDSVPDLGAGPFIAAIEPGYMEATGMRLLQGRMFSAGDVPTGERVTIVNEPMARTLWPGENPLTKCLQIFRKDLPCARVVGVVAESRRMGLKESSAMQYFVPYGQELGIGGGNLFARPDGDPKEFVTLVRRIIHEVDPTLMSMRVRVMQEVVDPLTRSWKLGATLFTIFGAIALVIAAMGLYSVVAYLVAQRTQEFGVRMALGARAGDIVRLVLRRGMLTVVIGLAAGLVAALFAGRYVAPLLFETSPRDAAVMTLASLTLLATAVLACWVPALRASRVDAAVALRSE